MRIGDLPDLNSPRTQSRSRLTSCQDCWSTKRAEENLLVLVTVNGKGRITILTQVFCDIVCDTLGSNEDDDLAVLRGDFVEVLEKFSPLLEVSADLNDLRDIGVGGKFHGADIDLDHVTKEVLGATQIQLLGRSTKSR